jgi:hypothetical protein
LLHRLGVARGRALLDGLLVQGSTVYRIDALAAALRSSSASYQSFNPRAVSAFEGLSPTQKPMLAISVKLSPRARKYVITSKRSGTGGHGVLDEASGFLEEFATGATDAAPWSLRTHGIPRTG